MKQSIAAASTLALTVALAAPAAFAEQQAQAGQQQQRAGMQQQGQQGQQMTKQVKDLTGMKVVNRQGKQIGDVDEIVRKSQDGKEHAVISVGGFLGVGDKDVAVPLDKLSISGDKVVLPQEMQTKSALEQQPAWDRQQYNELADSEQVQIQQSEFAAFEPGEGRDTQSDQGMGKQPGQSMGTEQKQGTGSQY
jgi:sporulation protein YlmC with PRC-barrel domain